MILDPRVRVVESDGISESAYNFAFAISNVPYLVLQAQLYEYFRIDNIHVIYKPKITEIQAPHSSVLDSTFVVPDLAYSFAPYSTTYSSFGHIAQRGDAVVRTTLERWIAGFRPIPLLRGFDNTINDAFMNLGPQWITTDRTDTPHFGFVLGIESSALAGPGPTFGGRLSFRYTVSFKNPRLEAGLAATIPIEESKEDSVVQEFTLVEPPPLQELSELSLSSHRTVLE